MTLGEAPPFEKTLALAPVAPTLDICRAVWHDWGAVPVLHSVARSSRKVFPVALDVYKEWLGIPEGPRPPDHYALLRLVQFEDDPDAAAAARPPTLR